MVEVVRLSDVKLPPEVPPNMFEYSHEGGLFSSEVFENAPTPTSSGDLLAYQGRGKGWTWFLMVDDGAYDAGYRIRVWKSSFRQGIELYDPIIRFGRANLPVELVIRPISLIDHGDILRIMQDPFGILRDMRKDEEAISVRASLDWAWLHPKFVRGC